MPDISLVNGTMMDNANPISTMLFNPFKGRVTLLHCHNFGVLEHPMSLIERQNHGCGNHWPRKTSSTNFVQANYDSLLLPCVKLKRVLFDIACLSHDDHDFHFHLTKLSG